MTTFDGINRLIITDSDTSTVGAVELYSRWADWVVSYDNLKYMRAFNTVGGDPLTTEATITPYIFLSNGWKVQPLITTAFEITGNLLPEVGQSVFSFAAGIRPETVRTLVLKSETISTGGGGDPSSIADAVWASPLALTVLKFQGLK